MKVLINILFDLYVLVPEKFLSKGERVSNSKDFKGKYNVHYEATEGWGRDFKQTKKFFGSSRLFAPWLSKR